MWPMDYGMNGIRQHVKEVACTQWFLSSKLVPKENNIRAEPNMVFISWTIFVR